MNIEREPFRTDLRSASLCIELDCNTIFDATRHRDCPTCGSTECYPLEPWLNRRRALAWSESVLRESVHGMRVA